MGLVLSLILNYIVVATVIQTVAFPAFMIISGLYPPIYCLTVCLASFTILAKHRANFLKLKTGEEIGINGKKIGFGKRG